jgi:hypothetical protein
MTPALRQVSFDIDGGEDAKIESALEAVSLNPGDVRQLRHKWQKRTTATRCPLALARPARARHWWSASQATSSRMRSQRRRHREPPAQ